MKYTRVVARGIPTSNGDRYEAVVGNGTDEQTFTYESDLLTSQADVDRAATLMHSDLTRPSTGVVARVTRNSVRVEFEGTEQRFAYLAGRRPAPRDRVRIFWSHGFVLPESD